MLRNDIFFYYIAPMKTSRLITWALAALGFGACDSGDSPAMYGTPYAEYQVSGTVTDQAGEPIEGIRVAVKRVDDTEQELGAGITDAEGEYRVEVNEFPLDEIEVSAVDVDGAANGEFLTETKTVSIADEDYVGGEGFFEGTVTKTVDFELNEAN